VKKNDENGAAAKATLQWLSAAPESWRSSRLTHRPAFDIEMAGKTRRINRSRNLLKASHLYSFRRGKPSSQ